MMSQSDPSWSEPIRMVIIVAGTAATYLWGDIDTLLTALVVFACVDYLTGVIAAAVQGELDSAVGANGIAKKVSIFAVVAVANILDKVMLSEDPILRTAVCWWYIGNEGISIVENVGKIGVPIPTKLKSALARLKDSGDSDDRSAEVRSSDRQGDRA